MPILHFKGKSVIQNHHHTVKFHELVPVKSKSTSKEPSLDDNLIIHGDNLIALKALLPTYAGKVKCIYIDPPYNTGNEHWIYNDNVNSPMIKEWLGKEVARDDLTRHDKWCCMMTPRLKLLRELLCDDGVICLSIDDNELSHLLDLLDEIFGEENKEEIICWRRRHNQPNDKSKAIAKVAEFIVVYAKNLEALKSKGTFWGLAPTGKFTNPDNDPKGAWGSKPWKSGTGQTGTKYVITTPSGKKLDEEWLGTETTYKKYLAEGRMYFPKNGDGFPRKKYYESERAEEGQVAHNFWGHEAFGSNQEASEELAAIGLEFDNPKPTRLIKSLLTIFSDKQSLILDSFAGTGTTAHAVLALNAEDGGNRKFILVECEDYADKITAERVRRVSKGVRGAKDEKLKKGLGGTFSYYELGKAIDIDKMLEGDDLPSYANLAHYAFFTATGETFDPKKMKEKDFYIGSSSTYEVFMLYAPDAKKLRGVALNLEFAEQIEKKFPKRPKLVFAPACFLEEFDLRERNIRFAQLPFEIYRLAE